MSIDPQKKRRMRILLFGLLCGAILLTDVTLLTNAASAQGAIETVQADAHKDDEALNLFTLAIKGGALMVPIGIMSVIVVTLVLERAIALRRERVIPRMLTDGLSRLAAVPGVMDPREAYRICQENKSPTSKIIQTMLLKIGRPHSEVDHVVAEASQREASRLYSNVRWLNLAAAVAPLMGLLGTVWGMIQAFFRTTQLQTQVNKADFLAEGIYVALVTTLGGLAVAIPAAIFAHYFEGRIQSLFHHIDDLVAQLSPQIERFEGKMRVSHQTLSGISESFEAELQKPNKTKTPRKKTAENMPT